MKTPRLILVILFTLIGAPAALADTPDPLFRDDATLRVEISAPFSQLINERPTDYEFEGGFTFRGPGGEPTELDLQVRARGRFRHKNCDFPPLFLNFKRSQVEDTLFDRQNKLKMVVHCKDSARYQQSVLREYLAYRILNELTDKSFNVRLLDVTYVDSENRRPRMVRSAFLIEHEDRLGRRLGMEKQIAYPDQVGSLQGDYLNLTSVFQYLIANTDFSPMFGSKDECCHNYTLYGNGEGPLLAIPYDFDMSGFVHTPYARPETGLGIDNVRQRLYQGFCANNRHVEASVAKFMQARDALYALVTDLRGLDQSVREQLTSDLDAFYATIADSQAVKREMLDRCIVVSGAG